MNNSAHTGSYELKTMPTTSQIKHDLNAWHPEDIKAAVRKKGTNLAQLSMSNGYNRDAAGLCLRKPWRNLEVIIAHLLNVEPCQIWPQRYNSDGSRKAGLSPRGQPRDCE